jgi:amino acid transporter
MAPNPTLVRAIGLRALTLTVVTSAIGSGWLFAPLQAARLAGPWALWAWALGGLLSFCLALVFAELGSLLPHSGAIAAIPLLTHGRLAGFIVGWSAWLAYLALPTVESLAVMQYLASSLPWLTRDGSAGQVLSPAGLLLAALLLLVLTTINLAGVRTLARWITGLTLWKLVIPLLTSITLMVHAGHWGNLAVGTPASLGQGVNGVVSAIGAGGILFSLLGFRSAMDLAGETRNPQRTVPLAMALGLAIVLVIYLLLQLAFLVAVPPAALERGWGGLVLTAHGGPMVALAMGAGLGWVARLLLFDAVLSPSATAMAYQSAASRVGWMMARCGLLPAPLAQLNRQRVPGMALAISLLVGVSMLLLGPTWKQVVSFLTASLVISLAMGPVSLLALRRQLPDAPRAFRLPFARTWCAVAFVLATWAISWCGRSATSGAVSVILLPALVLVALHRLGWRFGAAQQPPLNLLSGLWWFAYLGGIVAISGLLGPGASGPGASAGIGLQLLALAAWGLLLLPLAVRSALGSPSAFAMQACQDLQEHENNPPANYSH